MDTNELKDQHPATFAAAVQLGVTDERDRVLAHLKMGAASGDMATALKAVEEGSGMTASLQADYMAANMKKAELVARGADNPGDLKTPVTLETPDAADKVADAVCIALGYEEEGGKA